LIGAQARVETARALLGVKRADWFRNSVCGGGFGTQRQSESSFGANFPPEFGNVKDMVG